MSAFAASHPSSTTCFSVHAAAEPGVMPRVLELFAKRDIVPDRWVSARTGHDGEELQLDIQVEDLAPDLVERIAAQLRTLVSVSVVLVSEKGRPQVRAAG